jgi:hypothetical protein
MINREKLVRTSCQVHKFLREKCQVEFFIERFAKADKPRLTKLWVVNGEHEFKKERDAHRFAIRLCDEFGGSGKCSMESYKTTVKSYTKPVPCF